MAENGKIKLIALDMDGTLLLSDHRTIHPKNIEAIREAQKAGVRVWISTGRLAEDVSDFLHRADLNCGMICCNGSAAYTGPLPEGRQLLHLTFPPETARRVIDILLSFGLMINAFESCWVITVSKDPEYHYHLLYRGLIKERRGETALMESADQGVLKFYCLEKFVKPFVESELVERARAELIRQCPEIQVTRSAPGIIEIMPEGVGKGQSLIKAAAMLGIQPEEIMAVGDEENDLDMLRRIPASVAMANSCRSVLETCTFLTVNNDDGGVAEAIYYALGQPSRCIPNPHRI